MLSDQSFSDSSDLVNDSSLVAEHLDKSFIQNTPQTKEHFIALGLKAEQSLKFKEALFYYEKALEKAPLDIEVITLKALCLSNSNQFKEAISFITHFISSSKENIDYLCIKGQCYLLANKVKAANHLFEKCLSINPSHYKSLLYKGKCLIQLNEFVEAEKIFANLLLTDSRDKEANYFLGMCYFESKRFNTAIEMLNRAVEQQFDGFMILLTLAKAYEEVDNYKEACKCYQKHLRHSPTDEVYYKLSACYFKRKLYNKVINNLTLCLVLNKANEDAIELMIECLLYTNQTQKALEWYNKLIEINPNNIQAYIEAAQLHLRAKGYQEAELLLKQANLLLNSKLKSQQKQYSPKINELLSSIKTEEINTPCQCSFCLIY